MKTIVICSGGLDSVTLAYKVAHEQTLLGLVSFDYGQRHKIELDYAAHAAKQLGVPYSLLDMSQIGRHLSGSALTDDIDVPDGHYAEENMKVTVVPNRNAIMLSIGFGIAAAQQADAVAAAVHGGDHFIYPDCRPGFIKNFEDMQKLALDGYANVSLYTPFLEIPKSAIVTEGVKHNVPFADTWSCYKGGDTHCGRCGTCVERREAFAIAGVVDPTIYADPDYWKSALERAPL
ncbi:7-cyano-7-deazaguanine synthase QueC [Pseudovibrio sp. Tun.PSC04-5.I4]|uniref:7-cyano-7-deazaguanine synthase QueC n=1 Tax=Pseudovibrio sp. Tun.PSC04-5.I4 TaxID=1798213 RepID=UPI0008862CB4|nr:7-cyano-7-deazaguanine synthase QueC [Pseudovibrio sp. Tun.PSC04-5.I4]SDQ97978.1 7-cyano-7-deazaguanine synthase [Pseudovibrio sp. Tun.PSC04-5.I4]